VKDTFDIVDLMIPIINVASVTSTIDGNVHRIKKPINSELMDITIGSLPISGGHEDDVDLQQGTLLVNIFCKNFEATGQPDSARLETTAKAVIAIVEAYAMSSTYFEIDIINQSDPMEYTPQNTMSFISIRIGYVIQII